MAMSFRRYLGGIRRAVLGRPVVETVSTSYSQAGEDAIINFLFNDKGSRVGSYLDVGANVPDVGNNTYLFYLQGASGVLVEANVSLIDYIRKVRPRDTTLNIGVSTSGEEQADFYTFDSSGLNTFDKEEAERRSKSGNTPIRSVVSVPLMGINEIIENNFSTVPSLLSIDIEGLDLLVLQSLDFARYPVPVICVETCMFSENHYRPKNMEIIEFMISAGYFVYADTYINTIFVRKDWFEST